MKNHTDSHSRFHPNALRQRGAALVIGLILLLIMTVLGVSGLGTAAVEVRIADNNKQAEYSFQGGESAMREELVTGPAIVLTGAEVNTTVVRPTNTYVYEVDTGGLDKAKITVIVDTAYRNRLPALGSEYGTVDNRHFEIASDSRAARGARSRQRQGFSLLAPSP